VPYSQFWGPHTQAQFLPGSNCAVGNKNSAHYRTVQFSHHTHTPNKIMYAFFCDHYCRGKAKTITHSECVFVVLAIRPAKRMRHIILSSVACPALPYFTTLFHKRHDFRRHVLNIRCVSWFSLKGLSETFLILTGIRQDTVTHVRRSSCRVPVTIARL